MVQKRGGTKRKRAWWEHLLGVFCALAVFIGVVFCGARLFFRIPVAAYYKASERGFVIPGCSDGFVAQGIAYDKESNLFWVDGYQQKELASPIYLVAPGARKPEKMIHMLLPDGELYRGHAGGIAVYGDYVYVADGGRHRLLVFDYESLRNAADGESVRAAGIFETKASDTDYIGPAFVSVDGDRLIVGEFYRDPNYPTLESHKRTTLAGDYQQALAVVYPLDEQAEWGISPAPLMAYTLPDLAQGMCFDENHIYVSTSWGTAKSHIYRYDRDKMQFQGTILFLGEEIPLYALDSAALLADREIAPMSEEIVIVDGKLYTMCESASNKYLFGKLTSAKWCYATDVGEFF